MSRSRGEVIGSLLEFREKFPWNISDRFLERDTHIDTQGCFLGAKLNAILNGLKSKNAVFHHYCVVP